MATETAPPPEGQTVKGLVSGILVGIGVQRFRSFNPLPDQSVEAFKENVRWMTTPK